MLFHYILLPLTITLAGAETSLCLPSPPFSRTVPLPPTRRPVSPLCLPSTTAGVPRFVLLSRASLRTEGIHSRNSLLRGLFCCNRCSPLACTPVSFSPFFLPFWPDMSNTLLAKRAIDKAVARLIVLQILTSYSLTWINFKISNIYKNKY